VGGCCPRIGIRYPETGSELYTYMTSVRQSIVGYDVQTLKQLYDRLVNVRRLICNYRELDNKAW
jgi:hypothetical protein